MPHPFDEALVLQHVAPDTFQGTGDARFWNARGPFGGYAAALLLRTMIHRLPDDRAPRSLTIDFLATMTLAPFMIHTTLTRVGKGLASLSARLVQDDVVCAVAQGIFYAPRAGATISHLPLPPTPPVDEVPLWHTPRVEASFAQQFEYQVTHGLPMSGAPTAETGGWLRLREPRPLDALLLTMYADAWFPAIWSQLTTLTFYTTISLTIYFRQSGPYTGIGPADPVYITNRAQFVHEGFVDTQGAIWSADGRLLVQMMQIGPLAL